MKPYLIMLVVLVGIALIGCQTITKSDQMKIVRTDSIGSLEKLNVGIIRERDVNNLAVYKVVYLVDGSPEKAWEATRGIPTWLTTLNEIREVRRSNEVNKDYKDDVSSGTEQYEITWDDYRKQDILVRRDEAMREIVMTFMASKDLQTDRCRIYMGGYFDKTMVKIELRVINSSGAARILGLLVPPLGFVGSRVQEQRLAKFSEDLAMKHREATANSNNGGAPETGRTHIIAVGPGPSRTLHGRI